MLHVRTACGLLALGAVLAVAACDRDALFSPPDGSPQDTTSVPALPPAVPLGLVEVTISGIGTDQQTAMALPYRPGLAPLATFDLVPVTNNRALALDGAGDYVTADGVSDALAGAAAYTIEAWVYPDADAGAQQAIFGFHTSSGDNLTILFYEPDDDAFAIFIPPLGYARPPVQYAPGRWHHVALVVDGPAGDLYINGTAQTSVATTVRPELGGFFSIGQEYDGATATDFFQGRIDEVRVWNVARTQAEIQADMRREIDPATPDLVSYYRFDETSGTTADDLAGDNDGTLHGDAAFGAAGPALDGTANGDGTIQLEPFSTGSFTVGERGSGGYRYVYSSFRVRNAQTDGSAYGTPRENLTFLGVDTDGTIGHTAVSGLATFGGTEITGATALAIAESTIPTGAGYQQSDGTMRSVEPDVLQVLTEAEAAAVDRTGTTATDVFPYGFVVRTPSPTHGGRVLSGSPAADQFDGLVTFAFKVPLQPTAAEDPFAIRMVFLPSDDGVVRLTQSLEEQGAEARAAFAARAAALGASQLTLLPGGDYRGTIPRIQECGPVRVAGPADDVTGVLFPPGARLMNMLPHPFGGDAEASSVPRTTSLGAWFDGPVDGANPETFTVHSGQTGRMFLGQPYTGNGTSTVNAPPGNFFPGEEIEVTLTPQVTYCPAGFGNVARYRVAAEGGTASFSVDSSRFTVPGGHSIVAADLNGDGQLDIATANGDLGRIHVQLQGGAVVEYLPGGSIPQDLVAADLDGDGDLDLVTANAGSGDVSVFMNDGSGNFAPAVRYATGAGARSLTAGDLNGDGKLDLAVANLTAGTVSVLSNDGTGSFPARVDIAVAGASTIVSGDIDRDGDLDLVVGIPDPGLVSVLRNDGNATFSYGPSASTGVDPQRFTLADLDVDGDLHLAVAGVDSVFLLRNFGQGAFFDLFTRIGITATPHMIIAADFDGDGYLDLAALIPSRPFIMILENGNSLSFGPSQVWTDMTQAQAVASGDVDGDGDIDLLVISESGILTLLNDN